MQPTLVIMAAGMGSRYGGLKQLDPLGPDGETIMDYSIYDALRAGFWKIVFVIRKSFYDDFSKVCLSRYANRFDYAFVTQELEDIPQPYTVPQGREKPWGTGQALLSSAKEVNTPFCIINADDYYGPQTFDVMCKYLSQDALPARSCAMAGYVLANTLSPSGTVSRGICRTDSRGFLTSVTEHLKIGRRADGSIYDGDVPLDEEDLCSMNCWGFLPDVYDTFRTSFKEFLAASGKELKSEFLLPFIVNQMLAAGTATCRVLKTDSRWFGVTYREDRPAVMERFAALHRDHTYPTPLF